MTASVSVVADQRNVGTYYVCGQTWQVGPKYRIEKQLGAGSFSCVCLATDTETGQQVALKRIANVNSSPENAKRVLREICILRRLRHVGLIGLKDAFTKPSSTGPMRFKNGKFEAQCIDLYLALEYADGGDIFNFKGQLQEQEVKLLMWQLLAAVKYLHTCNVWHRDLKSANVLLSNVEGLRIAKIADLGSARSACDTGYMFAEQKPAAAAWRGFTAQQDGDAVSQAALRHAVERLKVSQHDDMHVDSSPHLDSNFQVQPGENGGLRPPLTRTICTPCYRAPEVVMSRGGYTSALDIWSVGCIFGELLQRVLRVGQASTPQLQVAPVFAMREMPKTPASHERFDDTAGHVATRQELQALFDVIGTPSWACIETVKSREWRRYLRRLPGRAPMLYRRYGAAGEVAVDLLSRMLRFDPSRRCSAEEAMAHEYFADVSDDLKALFDADAQHAMHTRPPSEWDLKRATSTAMPVSVQPSQPSPSRAAVDHNAMDDGSLQRAVSCKRRRGSAEPDMLDAVMKTVDLADDGDDGMPLSEHSVQTDNSSIAKHYWLVRDPAAALAALESEMVGMVATRDGIDQLRDLIGRECAAQHTIASSPRGDGSHDPYLTNHWKRWLRSAAGGTRAPGGLQPDPGFAGNQDPALLGEMRVSQVADRSKAQLDAEQHLRAGRHGEWTKTSGSDLGPQPGPRWGVSVAPPGTPSGDQARMVEIMRSQQGR